MAHNILEEREHALEEQFFKHQNEELVAKLKLTAQQNATKEELKRMTGIVNPGVLEKLAEMNVGAPAALVLSLYPLIEVAWADGAVQPQERAAILAEAAKAGVEPSSEAGHVLERWLTERPAAFWHQTWTEYVKALAEKMTVSERESLKGAVLGRAKAVAEAAGGFLGLGFSVSSGEKAVLETLAKAFG